MDTRKAACFVAAGFIGAGLTAAATAADAKPQRTVVVEGKRFDPVTQRIVSYRDLNLAFVPQQKVLLRRIRTTARSLCYDLDFSGFSENSACTRNAVHSTDNQVAAAIDQAKQRIAGRDVGPAIAISMVVGAR